MDILTEIKEEAKQYFTKAKGSHDWEHTERVYNLCMHIGKRENSDMEILKLASILHDIGREYQDKTNGRVCHAEKGAVLARGLMEKHNVDKEKIEKVLYQRRYCLQRICS